MLMVTQLLQQLTKVYGFFLAAFSSIPDVPKRLRSSFNTLSIETPCSCTRCLLQIPSALDYIAEDNIAGFQKEELVGVQHLL